MAPFGKGGGPQDRGIFAAIFMRSVAVTNCIFIRAANQQHIQDFPESRMRRGTPLPYIMEFQKR
jgi:hypothetical protein